MQQAARGHLARPVPYACLAHRTPRTLTIVCAKGKQKQWRQQQVTVTDAPDVLNGTQPAPLSAAPPLQQQTVPQQADQQVHLQTGTAAPSPAAPQQNWSKVVWRRVIRELSSLPRAIGIMAVITALSGLGTIIPQNKSLDYYMTNYPTEGDKVLGFLDYNVLLTLQLHHIYTAWYFHGSIALLAASLMACTYSTQWPTAKVAQRWRFATQPSALTKHGKPQFLPQAHLSDLGLALSRRSYQVFLQDNTLYAFKGLAGRLGPIGVHVALLMCLFGTAYSGFGGWKGSAMCPEGQEFVVAQAIKPASSIATPPNGAETVLEVNKFSIDTRPDGSVAQFYSDLTLRDFNGHQLLHKTISVNDPLRYGGVTMYQTDWSLAAITLKFADAGLSTSATATAAGSSSAEQTRQLLDQLQAEAQEQQGVASSSTPIPTPSSSSSRSSPRLPTRAFNLPLASLEGRPGVPQGTKLYATFLPLELPPADGLPPRGISMLARDLETVTFYDSKGQFVGVRRAGSGKPIQVEGLNLILESIIGSTGLEIKSDPGVPLVYAGFGGLMITTLISYVSHSQVWALQEGSGVYLVGRSNRSKVLFENELDAALDEVPEVPVQPTRQQQEQQQQLAVTLSASSQQ